ncbi:unnamed protein product [Withania somnifera]
MAKQNCVVAIVICILLLVNLCSASSTMKYPWFRFYHPWFHPHSWPFVHPPMPASGFRHRFPHPWPFMHPPKPSPSTEEKN